MPIHDVTGLGTFKQLLWRVSDLYPTNRNLLLLLVLCLCCYVCCVRPQSVQHVMGQVTSLAWALKLDPNLFTAGPEVLHAAKDAFTLAEREETLLLHKLVGGSGRAGMACNSWAPPECLGLGLVHV
jgi:hypothetical protein